MSCVALSCSSPPFPTTLQVGDGKNLPIPPPIPKSEFPNGGEEEGGFKDEGAINFSLCVPGWGFEPESERSNTQFTFCLRKRYGNGVRSIFPLLPP